MPAHVARLRAVIGHELLLLPSVSILPVDERGRVLLVRHAGDRQWAVLGGVVELGEAPAQTAVREAREEIGVDVRIRGLVDVLGGPDFEVTYPRGDRAAYVTAVFEVEIVNGSVMVDQEEVDEAQWFSLDQLHALNLNQFSRALLTHIGHLPRPAME
jgi:ADP-ribose pyrophosphatase YjhB (NUDIX family)